MSKQRRRKRPTARMRAQKPCADHCVTSGHLHLQPRTNAGEPFEAEVILVGYGDPHDDFYLSVWVGDRQIIIDPPELRAMAKGIVL